MPGEHKRINFDRPMLERLKKAHEQAVKTKQALFTFENNQYDVNYAKYLIEYLEGKLVK